MIVVDASAALCALLNAGPARTALAVEQIHAPHLIDSEVANGLRGRVRGGKLAAAEGWTILHSWRRMGMIRYATVSHLQRVWELRDNLSAYDAAYVALAEALGCALLTADERLTQAPGTRCPITIMPG